MRTTWLRVDKTMTSQYSHTLSVGWLELPKSTVTEKWRFQTVWSLDGHGKQEYWRHFRPYHCCTLGQPIKAPSFFSILKEELDMVWDLYKIDLYHVVEKNFWDIGDRNRRVLELVAEYFPHCISFSCSKNNLEYKMLMKNYVTHWCCLALIYWSLSITVTHFVLLWDIK